MCRTNQQPLTDQSSPQAHSTQEVPTEAAQRKKMGPKASNTQVQAWKHECGCGGAGSYYGNTRIRQIQKYEDMGAGI